MVAVNLLPKELRKKEERELERAKKHHKKKAIRLTDPEKLSQETHKRGRLKLLPSFFTDQKKHTDNKNKEIFGSALEAETRAFRESAQQPTAPLPPAVKTVKPKKKKKHSLWTSSTKQVSRAATSHTVSEQQHEKKVYDREQKQDHQPRRRKKTSQSHRAPSVKIVKKKKGVLRSVQRKKKLGRPLLVYRVPIVHTSLWSRLQDLFKHSAPPTARKRAVELVPKATHKKHSTEELREIQKVQQKKSAKKHTSAQHAAHKKAPAKHHFDLGKWLRTLRRTQAHKTLLEEQTTQHRHKKHKTAVLTARKKKTSSRKKTKKRTLFLARAKKSTLLRKLFPYTLTLVTEVKERKPVILKGLPKKKKKVLQRKKRFDVNFVKGQSLKLSARELEKRFLLLLWTLVGSVFVLVVAYGGLQGYRVKILLQRDLLLQQKERTEQHTALLEEEKNTALAFQKQLDIIENILGTHIYWTQFFTLLESYTLPSVFYDGLVADSGGIISLNATTDSLRHVGEQLIAFEQAHDFVKSVAIDGASSDFNTEEISENSADELVHFIVQLEIEPNVFFKERPSL